MQKQGASSGARVSGAAGRVKEAKARDELWLQGWETGLAHSSAAQWVPASDTSVPSQQASLRGHPRASHCKAGGYFEGKRRKLAKTFFQAGVIL